MLPALQAREVALRGLPSPASFLSRLAARPFALSNHRLFHAPATTVNALELDLSAHRFLLSVGDAGAVQIYDTAEGPDATQPRNPMLVLRHGAGDLAARCGAWHAEDCGLFVTGGADGGVWLWDAERAAPAAKLDVRGAVSGTCFVGPAVVAVAFAAPHASHAPQVRLWDVRQGPIAAHTFVLPAHATAVHAPRHAPFLVVGTAHGHLLSLDPRRPQPLVAFSESGRESGPALAHDKAVLAVASSPDARFLVSAAADHTVRLWSAPPLCRLQRVVYEGARAPLAVTAGGSLVAGAGAALVQCDLLTGRLIARLAAHLAPVHAVAAHPQEPLVLSAARDQTLLAWHPAAANRHFLPPAALARDER